MAFEGEEERREIVGLAESAERYVKRFVWCDGVGNGQPDAEYGVWYGGGIGPHVGVLLVHTLAKPGWSGLDSWTWVIVGDLPPGRISPWYCRNQYQALSGYAHEMGRWVDAAKAGQPVERLIPVNVAPTREYADMLARRLEFISEHLVAPNERLLAASVAADREDPPAVVSPGGHDPGP